MSSGIKNSYLCSIPCSSANPSATIVVSRSRSRYIHCGPSSIESAWVRTTLAIYDGSVYLSDIIISTLSCFCYIPSYSYIEWRVRYSLQLCIKIPLWLLCTYIHLLHFYTDRPTDRQPDTIGHVVAEQHRYVACASGMSREPCGANKQSTVLCGLTWELRLRAKVCNLQHKGVVVASVYY